MRKRILVIAECVNRDKTSEGISTSNFLNAIDLDFFDVDCVFFQFHQFELNEITWIKKGIKLIQIRNRILDVILQEFPRIKYAYSKLFGSNLIRARRTYVFRKFLKKHLKKNQYDLIFVRTIAGSIASHNAVYKLNYNKQFNWVAYFNDPVPITMYPKPYYDGFSHKDYQTRKEEVLMKNIVRNAHAIASPSEMLNHRILDFCGICKKHYVFPHVSVNDFKTQPSFLNKNKLNIVHAGSLLKERNPFYLLKALEIYIADNINSLDYLRVYFLGGMAPEHLVHFESFKYPEVIHLISRVPHQEALNIINDSYIMLLIEAISDESPFMPTKLAEYIGMNKLIWSFAPLKSETRRILGEDYYFQCEANDINSICERLFRVNQLFLDRKDIALNLSRLTDYIDPRNINRTLLNVFDS